MSIPLTAIVIGAAIRAIRRDQSNSYELLENWTLPLVDRLLPAYDGPLIRVEPLPATRQSRITVKAYGEGVCDGATLAPDSPRGVVAGSLLHDPWYLEAEAIAAVWGWTVTEVLRLGDDLFSGIMLRARTHRWVRRSYYNAVWHLGGLYRRAKSILPLICIALAMLLQASCSGCQNPPDPFAPDSPYYPPVYSDVASVIAAQ
ncbi:MAG: hypothetical protein M0Q49_01895 [Porticoccaceae bacterium]|nr:hypothetical protein [Porticoccaceae bacterium]